MQQVRIFGKGLGEAKKPRYQSLKIKSSFLFQGYCWGRTGINNGVEGRQGVERSGHGSWLSMLCNRYHRRNSYSIYSRRGIWGSWCLASFASASAAVERERGVSSLAWAQERLDQGEKVPDALTALLSVLLSAPCQGCRAVVCLVCESRRRVEYCGVPRIAF